MIFKIVKSWTVGKFLKFELTVRDLLNIRAYIWNMKNCDTELIGNINEQKTILKILRLETSPKSQMYTTEC